LPQQHNYNDWVPTQAYYAFAIHAGCAPTWAYGNVSETVFECLISKDTGTLQAASAATSSSGVDGTWAFLPVTDGVLIQSPPSKALFEGKLNGLNHWSSNAAEESFAYVPQNVRTADDLKDWIQLVFTRFNSTDIADLLSQYPYQGETTRFATFGNSGLTALRTSATASGYQQLANLIYAESTFVCSSYWLAGAYNTGEKKGFKAQYSIPIALHSYDGIALFGNTRFPIHSDEFVVAIQRIFGNFVKTGGPGDGWPVFTAPEYSMMNLNETGGREVPVNATLDSVLTGVNATWYVGPGLENKFDIVDGWTWEGGRGGRCEYWRGIAGKVPM
jgi:carboxylesterase type B